MTPSHLHIHKLGPFSQAAIMHVQRLHSSFLSEVVVHQGPIKIERDDEILRGYSQFGSTEQAIASQTDANCPHRDIS
jgi:hypothetical protein